MEKALQEKQGVSTYQPPQVTPVVTTAPPTFIIVVPSTILASTAEIITGASSIAIAVGSNIAMTTKKLIKAMEELKLQVSELKQVNEKLAKIE